MIDKKDLILQVAEQMFAENGFEGTSIRDLAAKADVNLAMISYYFGSKEKLFEELVLKRTAYMREMLQTLSSAEMDPWDKIYAVIDTYVERILSNITFHKIMFREISLGIRTEMNTTICEMMAHNAHQFANILYEGIDKKIFKDVDVPLTTASIIGTIHHSTLSKKLVLTILNKEATYIIGGEEHKTRLKKHLKELMKDHLQIQKDK